MGDYKFEVDTSQAEALGRRIEQAAKDGFSDAQITKALRQGARVIRDKARATAPVRKTGKSIKGKGRPGVLKRSIKDVTLKKRQGRPPAAKAAGVAPHAHLVELGTGPRFRGIKKHFVGGRTERGIKRYGPRHFFWEGTGNKFGYTGSMPPNPFFKHAVDAGMAAANQAIDQGIDKMRDAFDRKVRGS
ncbi:HK97 gp10 family phage protein [Candidatus Parcubacteria bacterium]|nr:MAG: HK97 gp10 family phage protein [Candidatus Parcubacteria bacterium]